jgi:hypothetical protein
MLVFILIRFVHLLESEWWYQLHHRVYETTHQSACRVREVAVLNRILSWHEPVYHC